MTTNECYQLGYISKTHGLKGEVMWVLDVDEPADYEEIDSVFVEIGGQLVPFFVDQIQVRQDKAIVQFEDVNTFEKAQEIVGCTLYLPLNVLPPLEGNSFYFHQIIGYQVTDSQNGHLGEVANVYNLPQQDLLSVMHQGKEILIPITDQIVTQVNHESRQISVNLPDGLLDVYLQEGGTEDDI